MSAALPLAIVGGSAEGAARHDRTGGDNGTRWPARAAQRRALGPEPRA